MKGRRMSQKKTRLQSVTEAPRVRPDAAGIDISPELICVAVDPQRDAPAVRSFGSVTAELYRIANWLRACKVKTVAMESTGVYWIPLFQVLESCGFEVFLVNARHYKNVPGRKTDVSDAAWLWYLHAVGLLSGSFRPQQEICAFRTLLRHRASLVESCSQHIQRMQKSLDQMNVQIHRVLSDITGASGLAIVEAILAGERDGKTLAALRHGGVKASEGAIVAALEGDYRAEHLFTLQQSLKSYRHYQDLIAECDKQMEAALQELEPKDADEPEAGNGAIPEARKKFRKRGDEAARCVYYRIFGVDLTAIPGVSLGTVQVFLGELGPDLSRFRSAGALASWLGLCPSNDISGGKVLASRTRKVVNRLTGALRMAAESLCRDKSYLGQFYRRIRAKVGGPEAITAAAHKMVRIMYHLITKRQEYNESQFMEIEQRNTEKLKMRLARQARSLGYTLVKA
jgi:transposase